MHRKHKIIFAVILGLVLFAHPVQAAEKTPDHKMMMEIAHGMVCLCGCGNQILATCTCGEAASERDYILSLVKMGKSKKDIVAAMIKMKGTEVLAAPEKKGMNWILWVVIPYILPVVAMIMVGYLLLSWSRKKPADKLPPDDSAEDKAEDEKYLKKLKDELDEFS